MRMIVTGLPQVGGRDAVTRAGRHWSKDGTLVDVDTGVEEDPPADEDAPEGAPLKLGRKTWEALKADKRLIRIVPEGDVEDIARLRDENARLKARIAELEAAAGAGETEPSPRGGGGKRR